MGNYKILYTLGKGGTCKVKKAWHQNYGYVAIKILKADLSDRSRQRVVQEVNILLGLNHLNILE